MKSKVKDVVFKKSGQGQYGAWHSFAITFDNGDVGDYMAKSNPQSEFVVGQEAEYEIKLNGQYKNVKPIKKVFGGGGFNSAERLVLDKKIAALNNSVALVVCDAVKIEKLRETFEKFLNEYL